MKSVHEAESGDLAVPVFAVHTGGRVFNKAGDLTALIESCIAEAKTYYTLGFDPVAADHTDEYHPVEVRMAKPGQAARTNAGYYAEPKP